MSQYDLMLYLKIKLCHCDLYFMVLWFCLISWRLFDVLLANKSVWLDAWPQNKSLSLWPIFYGSVAYILKTILCIRRWHWPGVYVSPCSLALVYIKVKEYGSLPKASNTLSIRTPKIIFKINFKMFPKILNSGLFSEIEFLKFRTIVFFRPKKEIFILFIHLYYRENLL